MLTRRQIASDGPRPIIIDLRDTCMAGISADDPNLTAVTLIGSDLHDASLPGLHGDLIGITETKLSNANLCRADFTGTANLNHATCPAPGWTRPISTT